MSAQLLTCNATGVRSPSAPKRKEPLPARGLDVAHPDPLVPRLVLGGRELTSVPLAPATLVGANRAVIHTDHASIDHGLVVEHARFVFDTRNATRGSEHGRAKVVRP